jgi:GTP cyclohydrolase I
MLIEQCTEKDSELEVTFSEQVFGGMVIVRNVPFVSWCAHHLVPFFGRADIGYIPNGKKLGLSKLARLVYSCSVGFTTQETITARIADTLYDNDGVGCLGCMVILEAEHGCMSLRGAKALGSSTVMSEVRGVFKDKLEVRQEMLLLISRGGSR